MLCKYAHSRQLIIFLFLISYVSVPILITYYHTGFCIFLIWFVGVFSSLNKSDSYQLLHVVVLRTFYVVTAVPKTRVGQLADPAVCPGNMDTPKILEDEGGNKILIIMLKPEISVHKTDVQEGKFYSEEHLLIFWQFSGGCWLFSHSEWKCL